MDRGTGRDMQRRQTAVVPIETGRFQSYRICTVDTAGNSVQWRGRRHRPVFIFTTTRQVIRPRQMEGQQAGSRGHRDKDTHQRTSSVLHKPQ